MKRVRLNATLLLLILSPGYLWGQHLGLGQLLEIFRSSSEHRETILKANYFMYEEQATSACTAYSRVQPDMWSREYSEGITTCTSGSLSYKSYSPDHSTNLLFIITRTYKFEDLKTISSSTGLLKNRYKKDNIEILTYNTKDQAGRPFWVFQFVKTTEPVAIAAIAEKEKDRTKFDKRGTEVVSSKSINLDSIGKSYAILIGINDYKNLKGLQYPVQDVGKLKKVLVDRYTFKEENITTLTNPTKAEIENTIVSLGEKVTEIDNVLLVFAGHGKEVSFQGNRSPSSSGRPKLGFWAASDAQAEGIVNWIACSNIKEFLLMYVCKHVLVISDACFSGAFFSEVRGDLSDMSRAYQEKYNYRSWHAMTSSAGTATADKSVFMELMVNRLERNNDTYLPAGELFSRFDKDVMKEGMATPLYGPFSLNLGGEFFFFRK